MSLKGIGPKGGLPKGGYITSAFAAQRQAILNGLDSDKAEATGWDALFKAIPLSSVVRTSDTVVTITIPALATFDITALETITGTIPKEVLAISADDVVATPTFTVDFVVGGVGPSDIYYKTLLLGGGL